jgi:hypothetical protein
MSPVRRWGRLVVGCGLIVLAYFYLPLTREEVVHSEATTVVIMLVAVVGMAFLVLLEVRNQIDYGEDRRIDRLVVAVVVVLVGFSLIFYLLNRAQPGQVAGLDTRLDALYFTLSTLSTIGYGDVHAAGQLARGLVVLQIVFNLVILTTAARLVSEKFRTAAHEREEQRRARAAQSLPSADSEA